MNYFEVPTEKPIMTLTISTFQGCNFTDHPSNVDLSMSPAAPNMIRDVPGKVRKCMGYEKTAQYTGRINGAHCRKGEAAALIHAGSALYRDQTALKSDLADERSLSWQFGERLYLIDGTNYLCYDGKTVQSVSKVATVPTVTIARAPSGGGTALEALNLLQPKFCEKFLGTATDKIYQLTFAPLDAAAVTVKKLTAGGNWETLSETTHFSVNRASGTITFLAAPGISPITGEDNIAITAERTVAGYAARIQSCRQGIPYGVNGSADRLFLGGGNQPNRDYYSERSDPTFFGDTSYNVLGREDSAILGYSVISDHLATHLSGGEENRNVVLRGGELLEGKSVFRITGTLQGPETIARYAFGSLANEAVFLTAQGIYAITAADITGERYAQNRSYYLNGKLLREAQLCEAYAAVFNEMYWLCINGKAYILDGLQPLAPEKNMPYSTRQYVGFYRTNLPARVLWKSGERLYFGTEDGRVCRFYENSKQQNSYRDDGVAIAARWETPDLLGGQFYKNKTFRSVMVRLASAAATSVKIEAQKNGLWSTLYTDDTHARYFDWSNFNWSKFTWTCDTSPRLIVRKIQVKKVNKTRFSFENNSANEPFGLFDIALEYRENGKAK